MKKIKNIFIVTLAILLSFPSPIHGDEKVQYELDFYTAKNMALLNSEKYNLQKEITGKITSLYEDAKKDYRKISPISSEFDGEVLSKNYSPLRNKDWKTLDKEQRENLLRAKIENTNKTLELFTNIIELENTLKLKNLEMEKSAQDLKSSKSLYEKGYITKFAYNQSLINDKKINDDIVNIKNNIKLDRQKFSDHLGLENTNFILVLDVPDKIISPKDALDNLKDNSISFQNLQDQMDELNKDLNLIKSLNPASEFSDVAKDYKDKIEDSEDDYDKLSSDKFHSLYRIQNQIKILSQQIIGYEIDLKSLYNNLYKTSLSLEKGLVIPANEIREKISIDDTKLDILKNHLKIENLIEEYINMQYL